MTQMLYDELWHYTERFTRDSLQRSELLTMAWKEGERLGKRSTPAMMKSMMHFRSKELKKRSAFPASVVGKRSTDAFNREGRVSLEQPISSNGIQTLGDIVLNVRTTPVDYVITKDFLNSLSEQEKTILEDLSAGYTAKEIQERHRITPARLKSIRTDLAAHAVAYL